MKERRKEQIIKKHKTRIAIIVILLLFILSAFLLHITSQQEKNFNKEQKLQLAEISRCIDSINTTIVVSREKLEDAYLLDDENRQKYNREFTGLMVKLDVLQADIIDTKENIRKILEDTDEKREMRQDEIHDEILSVSIALEEIKNEYKKAFGSIEEMIEKLKQEEKDSNIETITALTGIADSMEAISIESLSAVTNSLQEIENSLKQSITAINSSVSQNLGEFNSGVEGILAGHDSSVEEHFQKLNSSLAEMSGTVISQSNVEQETIRNVQDSMVEKIDEVMAEIGKDLEEYECSVENKYKELSDIITIGNSEQQAMMEGLSNKINEELQAVFQSVSSGKTLIASALLTRGVSINKDATFNDISNAILSIQQQINVQNMPGTISYTYHYHDSSCYYTCSGTLKHYQTIAHSNGVKDKYFRCNVCGRTWISTKQNDYADRPCGLRTVVCGMVDGQILSATIDFNSSVTSTGEPKDSEMNAVIESEIVISTETDLEEIQNELESSEETEAETLADNEKSSVEVVQQPEDNLSDK